MGTIKRYNIPRGNGGKITNILAILGEGEDVIAYLVENGNKEITEHTDKPTDNGYFGIDRGDGHTDGQKENAPRGGIEGDFPDIAGTSIPRDGYTPGESGIDNTSYNKKEKDSGLGKAKKIASVAIPVALIATVLIGIATAKDVETYVTFEQNDITYTEEIADLYSNKGKLVELPDGTIGLEYGEGEYETLQCDNPGELISELRERALAESLGRVKGREGYDAVSGEQRVQDEEKINAITQAFYDQQQIIREQVSILPLPIEQTTIKDKKEALEIIKEAKAEQLALFKENEELFQTYLNYAWKAYENPSDDRTDQDNQYLAGILQRWEASQENLDGDEIAIENIFYILQNPDLMYDEVSPIVGQTEENYYINIPGLGIFNGINVLKAEEVEVMSVTHDEDVVASSAKVIGDGQVGQGNIKTTDLREIVYKDTKYGVCAFFENWKSWGKGLVEHITGKNLTDPTRSNYEGR